MSRFVNNIHRLAAEMPPDRPSAEDETKREVGRELARQLLDALRGPQEQPVDSLTYAVWLGGKFGEEVLRGFLRELTDTLKGAHQ